MTGEVAEYVEVECDGSWDDAADELIRRLHDAGVENGQAGSDPHVVFFRI